MYFVFFKQKTAYEMRISDWSSDVCSSDLQRTLCIIHVQVEEFGNLGVAPHVRGDQRNIEHAQGRQDPRILIDEARRRKPDVAENVPAVEIGRASCRERVCQHV